MKNAEWKLADFIELALLLVGVGLLIYTLSPEVASDGAARFAVVESILKNGQIPSIKFSIVQPVLSLPMAYAARELGLGVKEVVAYFNVVMFVGLGAIILVEVARIFSIGVACRTLLVMMAMSMFPHHLPQYFGEVSSALLIASGVLLASRRPFVAAVLFGLGVANTPVLLVPAVAGAALLVRRFPALSAGVVVAGMIFAAENLLKFKSLTGSSYFSVAEAGIRTVLPYSGKPGFAYPVFFGVLSILFSFGKGILFFIPGLLLFFRKDTYQLLTLTGVKRWAIWAAFVALVLVYSAWWAWYGGNFWGPRFFLLLTVPAALALAVHLGSIAGWRHALILSALLLASAWVGIDGVVFGQKGLDACMTNSYQLEFMCWYVPEFSALWRPFVTMEIDDLLMAVFDSPQFPYAAWQAVVCLYLFGVVIAMAAKTGSRVSQSFKAGAAGGERRELDAR